MPGERCEAQEGMVTIQRRSYTTLAGIFTVSGLLLAAAQPAHAQNNTTSGGLTLSSTFDSISVRANYSGDANANNSATVRFRRSGGAWLEAFPPVADRRPTIAGMANPYVNQFRGSIVGLSVGADYEVEVTYVDPDGVSGSRVVSGTVSTLAAAPPTGGNNWYVDDVAANGDGSAGSPFNSIGTALNAAQPGDTIHLRPGSYAPFSFTKSGTASAWIAVIGDDRDSTFINSGAPNSITVNADYVQIKNLRFRPTSHNSVQVATSRHHVWLDNLYHEDVASAGANYNDAGILIEGGTHHVYVLNNIILGPTLAANTWPGSAWDQPGAGIYVRQAGEEGTFVFKGNTISGGFRDCIGNEGERFGFSTRDNTDIALNTITGCKDDGIQMEGDDINLRIWGNDVTANRGYSAVAMESSFVGPVYVFRNVLRLTSTSVAGSAFKIGYAVPTFYFHNTIQTSGMPHDGWAGGGSTGQVLKNNIIVTRANPLYCMSGGPGASYDFNLYYRPTGGPVVSRWNCVTGADFDTLAAFTSMAGQEAHGVYGDPRFVDGAAHLDTSSPAHDRGTVLPNFNDQTSAWPYGGTAPDMGALELSAPGSGASSPAPPANVRIVSSL